jgi:TonB family protein
MHFKPAVLCAALVAAAPVVRAQTQNEMTTVALAVFEQDPAKLAMVIRNGLTSDTARVRGIAARVANTRNVVSMTAAVRAALDRELDANAAREEARAAVMLGGIPEMDRALVVSERFARRFDSAIAMASTRDAMRALEYFITRLSDRVGDQTFLRKLLWGRPQLAATVMTRLIAANKTDAIQALLDVTEDQDAPAPVLDAATLTAVLTHRDNDVREEALWHVLARSVEPGGAIGPELKAAIGRVSDPGEDNVHLSSALELARRAAGFTPRNSDVFRRALAKNVYVVLRILIAPKKVREYLTASERPMIGVHTRGRSDDDQPRVPPPPFVLPSLLPDGAADAVMLGTGCRAGWLGMSKVAIDEEGRVISADVSQLQTDANCRRAIDALLRLSIVTNTRIHSPREATVTLVQNDVTPPCLDEANAGRTDVVHLAGRGQMARPRLRSRVPPDYPPGTTGEVVVEAVVSVTGCVRNVRIVRPSPIGAMNRAAAKAVSQWKFDPARFDGEPFEFLHKVTVEFH